MKTFVVILGLLVVFGGVGACIYPAKALALFERVKGAFR